MQQQQRQQPTEQECFCARQNTTLVTVMQLTYAAIQQLLWYSSNSL